VSLLTDALRLKEERRIPKRGTGPSLPPFRGPNRGYWFTGILGLVVCFVVGLACWKGIWALGKLEELAGFPPILPAKIAKESNSLNWLKEKVSPSRVVEEVKTEAKKELGAQEKPVLAEIPATGESLLPSVPLNPSSVARGEEKKKDEDLVGKSAEKKLEEKPTPANAVMDEKKLGLAGEAEPRGVEVPMGGLKPMKVELDEGGLVLEKPEEREKKRVDIVETFLRSLHVQGVRLQGRDSRILVDGAPIGLGEKVGSMGLVLESVESQKIIFSDGSGKKYRKNY
jgi:hypothetical protein